MRPLLLTTEPDGRRLAARGARVLTATLAALATTALLTASFFALTPSVLASTNLPPLTITASFPSGEPDPPNITATAALLIETDSGLVLYSKNPDQRLPMASTTKIMTAIVVLESLGLDTPVTVSRNSHFQYGSVVGLRQGEVATVEQLMYGLLVFSGNDAAVALAEKASGSVDSFVARMNAKAEAMGLTNTYFENPDGLQAENHYSSCTDLATMAQYAMQNPVFRQMVDTPVYYFPHPTRDTPRELTTSNVLLTRYDWVNGIKTGSTPYAGYCMVASGSFEGVSLLVVLLGAVDDATRWSEVDALFKYGFGLYPRTVLADPGGLVAEVGLSDPLDLQIRLVADRPLVMRLGRTDTVTGSISLVRDLDLPVIAGEVFGTVDFAQDGTPLGSVNLVAERSVYTPSVETIIWHVSGLHPPELPLPERGDRHPR
jgi:D-alanyl-D-alanine carboxypeptidase (penicillin-binding protein 5/6)